MSVRAPGKIVISGAYAVLEDAPAIVSAVDRFVLADAARASERVTPEVREALGTAPAPWFDASRLREGEKKLGLGSSAAILVASLAARVVAERGELADRELAGAVLEPALAAHQRAQAGGSGVDVVAAARGGTLIFRRNAPAEAEALPLPGDLVIETWWSGAEASTASLVARVFALKTRDPSAFGRLLGAQRDAALAAEASLRSKGTDELVRALAAQRRALAALGDAAGVPIVTEAARGLADLAEAQGAAALPAGAGGGDALIYAGRSASGPAFRELAARHGHRLLALALGARGVHVSTKGTT
jgi:phosphomevalonate kinase